MNAFELAELAALVSVHSRHLVAAEPGTAERSLAVYWKASRCRLDRWGYSLRSLRTVAAGRPWPASSAGILAEILVSEILSRTIAAIAAAHDQRQRTAESAPIGRNILTGHIDARRRAVAIVGAPGSAATDQAQTVLALARQSSRWCDLVLAYLSPHADVAEFAVSPRRAHDFAYDARQHLGSAAATDMAVTMILAGLRSSLDRRGNLSASTPNADLNLEIATAVVGWFEPALFDSLGLPGSEWLARLRNVPNETLARLDQWWQPPPVVSAPPATARWRR
jgi:hypothetical protein